MCSSYDNPINKLELGRICDQMHAFVTKCISVSTERGLLKLFILWKMEQDRDTFAKNGYAGHGNQSEQSDQIWAMTTPNTNE